MELQLVSREVAILAKDLGFDWECSRIYIKDDTLEGGLLTWRLLYYENDGYCSNSNIDKNNIYFCDSNKIEDILCTAPEQELLAKWLRDIHKLFIGIDRNAGLWIVDIINLGKAKPDSSYPQNFLDICNKEYNSYEEAMEQGLLLSLNIIKLDLLKS